LETLSIFAKKPRSMKNKFLVALLAFSGLFISCKDNKAEDAKPAEAPKVDNAFTVMMDLVVQKDDSFQIFYNEDGSDNYTGDKSVTVNVKGSPDQQEVVFKLPEDAVPGSLRFDMGGNKDLGEVKIVNFKMRYYGKDFVAKDTMFVHYFWNNQHIKYIRDKAIAVPSPLPDAPYDPFFMGTAALKLEIQKLVK
jgi:hypothetical protein